MVGPSLALIANVNDAAAVSHVIPVAINGRAIDVEVFGNTSIRSARSIARC